MVNRARYPEKELEPRNQSDILQIPGLLGVLFRLIGASTQRNLIVADPLAANMVSSAASRRRNSLLCLHSPSVLR